jgi:hypothetical protein
MELSILNQDSTYGVVVDGNASETIDGATTRKTYLNGPITIVCDGSNWYTKAGKWRYRSTELSYSVGVTAAGLAHGLGVRPTLVWCEAIAQANVDNFATGDVTGIPNGANADSGSYGICIRPTATSIEYTVADLGLLAVDPTGSINPLTTANWKLRIYAEA